MFTLEKIKKAVIARASDSKGRPEDNRRVRRIPQRMKDGFIFSEPMIFPRAVVIRDLSVGGARIQVVGEPVTSKLVVDGLRLYFASEQHEISCHVAWMKGQTIGLKFQGSPRPPSRNYK